MKLPTSTAGSRRVYTFSVSNLGINPAQLTRSDIQLIYRTLQRNPNLFVPELGFGAPDVVTEDCKYGGVDYTEGSTLCQGGTRHKCSRLGDGSFVWTDEGTSC